MPTLLDLCGVKIPNTVQGTSFAPVLMGSREVVGDNVAYIETTVNEGIRTRRCVYWCNRKHFGNETPLRRGPRPLPDEGRDPRPCLHRRCGRPKGQRPRPGASATPSGQPADLPPPTRGETEPML